MTDISTSGRLLLQLAPARLDTAALPRTASTARPATGTSSPAAQTPEATATGSGVSSSQPSIGVQTSTPPTDSISLSAEALAKAYDQSYLQWMMGRLYADDIVAGAAVPGDLAIAQINEQTGETTFATNMGDPRDDSAFQAVREQIWGPAPEELAWWEIPTTDRELSKNLNFFQRAIFENAKYAFDQNHQAGDYSEAYLDDLEDFYRSYASDSSGNLLVDPMLEAIGGLYNLQSPEAAVEGALAIAFHQRGISRDDVATVDIAHVALDGKVMVTFKDGRDPLALDENYVSYFASVSQTLGHAQQKEAARIDFYDRYESLLKQYDFRPTDIEGWTVTKDGKFHLYSTNPEGDDMTPVDHVIDDMALAMAATRYSQMSLEELRLAQARRYIGGTLPATPFMNRVWISGPIDYNSPAWDLAAFPIHFPDYWENTMPTSGKSTGDDLDKTSEDTAEAEESEEEKEAARARRKLLLSMGIRAESDPDANKPDWMSSGEIARLNARYADAMSARDRMLQRFSRKGELEGFADGVIKQTPEEIAARGSGLSQKS